MYLLNIRIKIFLIYIFQYLSFPNFPFIHPTLFNSGVLVLTNLKIHSQFIQNQWTLGDRKVWIHVALNLV